LKIGVIFPIFQSFGNNPVSKDLLNTMDKGTHKCSAQFLRMSGGHPPGPRDLLDLKE